MHEWYWTYNMWCDHHITRPQPCHFCLTTFDSPPHALGITVQKIRTTLKCKYRRGCYGFQMGHGFSNMFDCPLKIKLLIENFLSLKQKAEISVALLVKFQTGSLIWMKGLVTNAILLYKSILLNHHNIKRSINDMNKLVFK